MSAKWCSSPDVVTLRVWCTRSPLVISTSRALGADRGEHLGHVGEQVDRLGQHVAAEVDELADHPAGTVPSVTVIAAAPSTA